MLNYVFREGKHKGKTLRWIRKNDVQYLKSISTAEILIDLPESVIDLIDDICEKPVVKEHKIVSEVVEKYKEGFRRDEIIAYLGEKGYAPASINIYMAQATSRITASFEENKSYIIGLHLKRYDQLYNKHIQLAHGKPGLKLRFKRMEHYVVAMDSLLAKEKLLGLHSKKYNIQLNNFIGRDKIKGDRSGYNFSQLTTEELVELVELMNLCKSSNYSENDQELIDNALIQTGNMVKKIVQNVEEDIEETDFEEIQSPLSQVQHTDEYGNNMVVRQKRTGRNIIDLTDSLNKTNESTFDRMIREKMNKR